MHGYPVMQFVQYSMPPPHCTWVPPPTESHHRTSAPTAAAAAAAAAAIAGHRHNPGIKKYVIWCLVCGGCSCILGVLFLGLYFLLHSYTITVGNFETVPTFVPGALLILTGMCIMSLARRKNRYSYLIKLSGACGLISALTCALVTVTTTVLHMSRLQALRECEYAQKTRTCTCYSDVVDGTQLERGDKEGVRLVFDSLSDCGVVHGSLYSCLRAIFGLSVAGVLIAVFSCMLVYQLLSHERKKMYWEQLELRCRSLYTSQQPNVPPVGSMRGAMCRCCESCHAHRQQMPLQLQMPGNFYSPNPGVDEHHLHGTAGGTLPNCRGAVAGHRDGNATASGSRSGRMTGWNWPWQRNSPLTSSRFARQTPSSPDSQYGFSQTMPGGEDNLIMEDPMATAAASAAANAHAAAAAAAAYNALPYGVWGPPPPYSDPNSPARRGFYHYVQPQQCPMNNAVGLMTSNVTVERQLNPLGGLETQCLNHRPLAVCSNEPNGHGSTAVSLTGLGTGNNTLPNTRKPSRKRQELGPKNAGDEHQQQQSAFDTETLHLNGDEREYHEPLHGSGTEDVNGMANQSNQCLAMARNGAPCKQTARPQRRDPECQPYEQHADHHLMHHHHQQRQQEEANDPTESEVYFADVSSCNMSVKNDNYYEEANSKNANAATSGTPNNINASSSTLTGSSSNNNNHNNNSNSCSSTSSNDGDYLAQRFGKRENSIRSRLPFPQTRFAHDSDYGENLNVLHGPPKPLSNSQIANIGGGHQQQPSPSAMHKEVSRQSMCSVESEAKTEYTDLSPSTPCSNKFAQTTTPDSEPNGGDKAPPMNGSNFVASMPYSSESQSLEAHRRSTKDIHELMLAPPAEAHYEIINDTVGPPQQQQQQHGQGQFALIAPKTITPSGGGHAHGHNHTHAHSHNHGHSHTGHGHAHGHGHGHGHGHAHGHSHGGHANGKATKPKSKSRERLNISPAIGGAGGPLQTKEVLEWSEKSSISNGGDCGDRRL